MRDSSLPTPSITPEARAAAAATTRAKRAAWAKLDLKQDFDSEEWMRECAAKAGVRVLPPKAEPATAKRLRQLARRMGLTESDCRRLAGTTFQGLIDLNPKWPLWALTAFLAEMKITEQEVEDDGLQDDA